MGLWDEPSESSNPIILVYGCLFAVAFIASIGLLGFFSYLALKKNGLDMYLMGTSIFLFLTLGCKPSFYLLSPLTSDLQLLPKEL
jgi:hypothetical protein